MVAAASFSGRLSSLREPKVVEFAKLVSDRSFRLKENRCAVIGQKNLLELARRNVAIQEVLFPMRASPNRRKKPDEFVAAAVASATAACSETEAAQVLPGRPVGPLRGHLPIVGCGPCFHNHAQ